MFSRQCIKFGTAAPLLIAALIAGGCSTTTLYQATPEDTRDLSPAQARKLLTKTAQASPCSHYVVEKRVVRVTYEKIHITCNFRPTKTYRFAEDPALVAHLKNNTDHWPIDSPYAEIYSTGSDSGSHSPMFYTFSHSVARDLVRAWYVLARTGTALYLAQEAAFEQAAQNYRTASVKPQLPEEAVKYKVQAELAVQQKRFDDAVDLYDQALGIAPWWPAGHYNLGLILGELQAYQEGIRSLQKYLKLEPDAVNARAVQLKIYQWESLVPRAAK